MDIVQPPISDSIRETLLTTLGDYPVRGVVSTERQTRPGFCKVAVSKVGANQALASTGSAVVTWDTVIADTLNYFDNANDRIIPLKQGLYLVYADFDIAYPANAGNIIGSLRFNGVAFRGGRLQIPSAVGGTLPMKMFSFCICDGVDDYIDVYCTNNLSAGITLNAGNSLAQFLVMGPF